jgi:GxxExxY protein
LSFYTAVKAIRRAYKGKEIAWQRLDLLVEGKVIVEVKSTATLPITAMRQPQNYLQATRFEIGLLLHFGPVPKPYRFYAPSDRKHLPRC